MDMIRAKNGVGAIELDSKPYIDWQKATNKNELMVEVFKDEIFFEELSAHWNNLKQRTDSLMSMPYEWAYNWWKHYRKNKKRTLFLITVWDGTRLVAIAPLYKDFFNFGELKPEPCLRIIGSRGGYSSDVDYLDGYNIIDFLDFLVDASYKELVTDKFSDVFTPDFLKLAVLDFNQVNKGSYLKRHLYPILEENHFLIK